jgi:hypothetical protein
MREMRERLELRGERTRIFARPDPFAQLAQPPSDSTFDETSEACADEPSDPQQGRTRVRAWCACAL